MQKGVPGGTSFLFYRGRHVSLGKSFQPQIPGRFGRLFSRAWVKAAAAASAMVDPNLTRSLRFSARFLTGA